VGKSVAPAAAAWIRTMVLPAAYLASTGDPAVCPCQYGPSGHCAKGRCEKCPRTWGWPRHGQADPDTYISSRSGGAWAVVPGPTALWRAGPACRWLCPHTCHATVAGLFSAPAPAARTGGRTGGNQISSTDRLRRDDPDGQLDLFAEVNRRG